MSKKIDAVFGIIVIALVIILWVIIRLENPDMTETRLILTFPVQWIVSLIAVGYGAYMVELSKK